MGFINEQLVEVAGFCFVRVDSEIVVKIKTVVIACKEFFVNRIFLSRSQWKLIRYGTNVLVILEEVSFARKFVRKFLE